jgi:hypothetical protein
MEANLSRAEAGISPIRRTAEPNGGHDLAAKTAGSTRGPLRRANGPPLSFALPITSTRSGFRD